MTGYRKLLFAVWAFTLTWCAFMWAPGVTEPTRMKILILQGSLASLLATTNAYEHRQKRMIATSGTGQVPPPDGAGSAPAADTEAAASPAGAPNGMETQ